jgi:protoporphyrin/coproporphyrin ferrochelatase
LSFAKQSLSPIGSARWYTRVRKLGGIRKGFGPTRIPITTYWVRSGREQLGMDDSSTPAKTAVLLVNLGTPDAPTPQAVRRYLAEFLRDPRVIDYPRLLWLPILYGAILRIRPKRSAHAYSMVWTPQGSPLMVYSRALTEKVGQACADHGIRVELAMRYGNPSIPSLLERLVTEGVRKLLVLPLYPQYSATSTATAFDAVHAALARTRHVPELRNVGDYHAVPAYIDALAESVRRFWSAHGRADRLLLSFHGIPNRYVKLGDPYAEQCRATAELLRDKLGLGERDMLVTFQSRVGRETWLTPYTDVTLGELPKRGVKRLQVMCPGFAVDCLETLEEIAIRGRNQFMSAGGEQFDYIPALNSDAAHVDLMRSLIERHTRGWNA